MKVVFSREWHDHSGQLHGHVFWAITCGFACGLFVLFQLVLQLSNLSYTLNLFHLVAAAALPILCLHAFTFGNATGTNRWMDSLPISPAGVAMGKYLAVVCMLVLPYAVICLMPLLMLPFGTVNLAGSYLMILSSAGFTCLLAAVCSLICAVCNKRLAALLVYLGVMLVLFLFNNLVPAMVFTPVLALIVFLILGVLAGALSGFYTRSYLIGFAIPVLVTVPVLLLFFLAPGALSGGFEFLMNRLALFNSFKALQYEVLDLTVLISHAALLALCLFWLCLHHASRKWLERGCWND